MEQETHDLLQEADWEIIRRELLAHATWRAQIYRWRPSGDLELAAGYTVDDVVHEVITKALGGLRKWNPDRGALFPWLQSQSRSILDALAKSAPHRREVRVPDLEDLVIDPAADPLEILVEKEAWMQKRRRVERLIQAIAAEPELEEIVHLILSGCEPKPRYLAAEIGITVDEVNNRMKRLRRRALRSDNHSQVTFPLV